MSNRQAYPHLAWALIQQGYELRVGRSLGRAVYVQTGGDDPKSDLFIGVMDSPLIAAYVVEAVNRLQRQGALAGSSDIQIGEHEP